MIVQLAQTKDIDGIDLYAGNAVQGTAAEIALRWQDGDGAGIDLTAWQLAAKAEWHWASGVSSDASAATYEERIDRPAFALAVAKAAQAGETMGEFSMALSADAWPEAVAIDEADRVPVLLVEVAYADAADDPDVAGVFRCRLAYRHGVKVG